MINESKYHKKILVIETVDDNPSLLSVLNDKLTIEGYSVLGAKDGEEGFNIAIKEHPDLIILDILMPKMDGITMMKKVREDTDWGKTVPIILLTNLNADDENIIKAVAEYGPAYYLVKADWKMSELIEKIKERIS